MFLLFSELYLDGNSLQCVGFIHLIEKIIACAEQEKIERDLEKEQQEELPIEKNMSIVSNFTGSAVNEKYISLYFHFLHWMSVSNCSIAHLLIINNYMFIIVKSYL